MPFLSCNELYLCPHTRGCLITISGRLRINFPILPVDNHDTMLKIRHCDLVHVWSQRSGVEQRLDVNIFLNGSQCTYDAYRYSSELYVLGLRDLQIHLIFFKAVHGLVSTIKRMYQQIKLTSDPSIIINTHINSHFIELPDNNNDSSSQYTSEFPWLLAYYLQQPNQILISHSNVDLDNYTC